MNIRVLLTIQSPSLERLPLILYLPQDAFFESGGLIVLLGITSGCSKLFYAKMPEILQKGKEFDNFEDFKEYMETIPEDMAPGEIGIRRKFDNYKGIVYGDNGEILCEYRRFNDSVVDIQFGKQNKLPITVYSENDQTIAEEKTEDLMWIWNAVIVLECISIFGMSLFNFIKLRKN